MATLQKQNRTTASIKCGSVVSVAKKCRLIDYPRTTKQNKIMSRTPVEWISIGAGTLILGGVFLLGALMIGGGLIAVLPGGVHNVPMGRGMIGMGVAILAVPVVLYGLGKGVGRGWNVLTRPEK